MLRHAFFWNSTPTHPLVNLIIIRNAFFREIWHPQTPYCTALRNTWIAPYRYPLGRIFYFPACQKWSCKGPFNCYVTLFFWKLDPHPPPRNANNIEHLLHLRNAFFQKIRHPHLRYVTLEWPPMNKPKWRTCNSYCRYNSYQLSCHVNYLLPHQHSVNISYHMIMTTTNTCIFNILFKFSTSSSTLRNNYYSHC